jgi:hypothetical protein
MVETSEFQKDLKRSLPPSLQPQKRRTGTSWVHVEAYLIGCLKFLFLKLFITIFGVG